MEKGSLACRTHEKITDSYVYCPACKKTYSIVSVKHFCGAVKCHMSMKATMVERSVETVADYEDAPSEVCADCTLIAYNATHPRQAACPCGFQGWYIHDGDSLCPACKPVITQHTGVGWCGTKAYAVDADNGDDDATDNDSVGYIPGFGPPLRHIPEKQVKQKQVKQKQSKPVKQAEATVTLVSRPTEMIYLDLDADIIPGRAGDLWCRSFKIIGYAASTVLTDKWNEIQFSSSLDYHDNEQIIEAMTGIGAFLRKTREKYVAVWRSDVFVYYFVLSNLYQRYGPKDIEFGSL